MSTRFNFYFIENKAVGELCMVTVSRKFPTGAGYHPPRELKYTTRIEKRGCNVKSYPRHGNVVPIPGGFVSWQIRIPSVRIPADPCHTESSRRFVSGHRFSDAIQRKTPDGFSRWKLIARSG
jgi:hypothetical protein